MTTTFDPTAPTPTTNDDNEDYLDALDAVDEAALADYVAQVGGMRDDVVRLFVTWFMDTVPDRLVTDDEAQGQTWADLVDGALEDWRPAPGPRVLTVTVVDDHEDEGLADVHGDPWNPADADLELDADARRMVIGHIRPDLARRLVVRDGHPRPISRTEEGQADADGVVGRFVLVPRYTLG